MGRPRIGTPEEAAERKRHQTAARVRRLRERRRAEQPAPSSPPAGAPPADDAPAPSTPVYTPSDYAATKLRLFVERIERLDIELAGTRTRSPALAGAYATERATIQAELKAVWKELGDTGFSPTATREILRLRKMDEAGRRAFETTVFLYKRALGMD